MNERIATKDKYGNWMVSEYEDKKLVSQNFVFSESLAAIDHERSALKELDGKSEIKTVSVPTFGSSSEREWEPTRENIEKLIKQKIDDVDSNRKYSFVFPDEKPNLL